MLLFFALSKSIEDYTWVEMPDASSYIDLDAEGNYILVDEETEKDYTYAYVLITADEEEDREEEFTYAYVLVPDEENEDTLPENNDDYTYAYALIPDVAEANSKSLSDYQYALIEEDVAKDLFPSQFQNSKDEAVSNAVSTGAQARFIFENVHTKNISKVKPEPKVNATKKDKDWVFSPK